MSDSNVLMQTDCPDCGSTDANTIYDDGHSHCFSCGRTVQGARAARAAQSSPRPDRALLPVDTRFALTKRGLTAETLEKWGYGVASMPGNRLVQVAQYADEHGAVMAQKIRHPDKRFEWVGNRHATTALYGQWLWPAKGRRVTITEGELDALSVSQAQGNRWPVVSVPDGAQSAVKAVKAAAEWLAGYETVVLMFDMDEAGQKAAKEVAKVLRPGQALIARLPMKDASDMLQAGRAQEIVDATWRAAPYRPDGLVAGEALREHLARPVPPSVPVPFPELQAVLGGIRRGEITLLVAGSGAGKSTLARTIALSVAEHQGMKVGYVALEESVQRTVLDLTSTYLGRNLREDVYVRGDMTATGTPEVQDAVAWVADRFVLYDHFGSLEADRLQEVLRHMVVVEGCGFIVLDHISIVVSGGADPDERKAIDRIMTTTRSMVQETGVGAIVVSHLKRRGGDAKGYEEGAIPRLSDARGSGGIEQMSDSVIAMARDMTAGPDGQAADLYVLKNRTIGRLGPAGSLRYDDRTARMVPTAKKAEAEAMFPAGDEGSPY